MLDRVGLIIEIFNAHAFTKEAKLQVGDVSWCPCSQIELNVLCLERYQIHHFDVIHKR